MNPNKLLGVTTNASASEIQQAFRQAAMEVHPDHSSAPEAAEAFMHIKQARDELMQRAKAAESVPPSDTIHRASATAAQSAQSVAYTQPLQDDAFDSMSPEEIAHIQELDRLVQQYKGRLPFRRPKESEEVRRHRRTIETKNRRIMGKY